MDPSPFYVGLLVVYLDLYFFLNSVLDPDSVGSANTDPDSVKCGTDPKHWKKLSLFDFHNTIFLKDIRFKRILNTD
jgi:hypothetical protein